MKKILHRADSRGFADHGWLKSYHTFSFAEYFNPERKRFGLLRVLNDDWIEPGRGFDTHAHEDMEIVTIPLTGSLKHKDSMGNEYVIRKNEVQRMSAGTGVTHSEYNNSKTEQVNLLQIWVFPREKGLPPGYGQKLFEPKDRDNRFQFVITPKGTNGSISINQDAYFALTQLESAQTTTYEVHQKGHGLYLFVIDGEIECEQETLSKRDAVAHEDIASTTIHAKKFSEVLAIEIPMSQTIAR